MSFSDLALEVQGMVGACLNYQDLSACVLVCRAWKSVFHPYLWRHIDIDWRKHQTNMESFSEALAANHHLVCSLKLRFFEGKIGLRSFLECCPPTFPRLRSADIERYRYLGVDVHIAAFIDLSSAGWKRLLFRTTPGSEFKTPFHFSTLSVEALCKHTSTLEVFHVEAKTFIPGRGINHLLCSAPLLKELNLMANHKEPYGSWMDVDMIADSEWVCKDLEVFACEIGNIRRLDITRDIGDELMEDYISQPGKHQKSIEVQRKIYSKLAKFTKLRVLNLGVVIDTTDSDYQLGDKEVFRRYDSLAMTIESGLDLLKGLKELRVVDLSNMEVYIDGEPEQSWFKEHWPLANVITTGYLDE